MANKHRIGVDMAAAAGQKSGLGFYVDRIVKALHEVARPDEEIVEINRIKKNLRTPSRIAWDQYGLPLTAMMKKLDMLFVPAFSAPRFSKPIVMTAHDIFGVLYPDQFSGMARRYWTHTLPQSFKRAEHLLCVSEHTRQDLATHLGIPLDHMTVTPLAASDEFRLITDQQALAQAMRELQIDGPFILSVGTLEPRKNFEKLLDAYIYAQRKDVKLVLVGKKGWKFDGIYERIRKYHLQNAVVILDYVTQDQLVALYNTCEFFVMPSIFEGFGLPALEAMQCGAAVAVSQNTSLPEVVGDAGVLFDPFSVESIRARMDLLISNEELRTDMRKKSLERAKQFSWNNTAEQSLAVFRNYLPS